MKIIDAKVIVCSPGRNFVTLKITTDNGLSGIGDATLNGRELSVASYLTDHVIPCLIGRDAHQIEDIWQYLYRGAYWRRGPVTMTAIAAVDTALWDIKAKAAGMPLYQLLGGQSRTGVMVYGHANGADIDQTVEQVLHYKKLGYKAIRAQSGVPGLEKVYGVGRGTLFYEPADSSLPSEERAGIGMPEVAVYDGEPNAFATGAFKNSALVAVSTGLLQSMNRDEVEAVLGHEVAHIANGDMVTLTLIQGVVNTFVVFLARVVGYFVDKVLLRGESDRGPGIGYMVTVFVCEIIFGLLASIIVAWFSRQREFRADAGSAKLMGSPVPMQHALARLGGLEPGALPQSMAASGISGGGGGWGALFSTHPPMEQRIAALSQLR